MPSRPQLTAQVERRYAAVLFLNWFAVGVPGAVMVLYAQSRGLSLAHIGIYGAVYSVTVALLNLPTGHLADRIGRVRVTLFGLALAALARLALLFAFSLPGFVLYALLWGAARALNSGALDAWFVAALREVDPKVDLQPALARMNTVELIALSIGPLVGGGLAALLTRTTNVHGLWSPLAMVIGLSLLLQVLTLGVTRWLIQTEEPSGQRARSALRFSWAEGVGEARAVIGLIRENALLPTLLLLEGVTGWMLAASETYWQPFFAQRFGLGGGSATLLGVILAGCYVAGVLGNLSARPLLRFLGGSSVWLGGITQVIQAAALLVLAWQGSVLVAMGLLWLTYLARTAYSSSFMAQYNGEVPEARRSLMLSVLSVALFAGVTLGNLTLGAVSSRWSIAWAWSATAGLQVISAVLFVRLARAARTAVGHIGGSGTA